MSVVKTVVVGAGFAGLEVARKLCGKKGHEVVLIDKNNHHLFQPLLYQLATAALSSPDISEPIKNEFSGCANVTCLMDELQNVNLGEKKIQLINDEISYDNLVLACGSKTNYFGNKKWQEHSYSLKTLQEARKIRNRVLMNHELAAQKTGDEQEALETFIVVGGGPTGVEMAGSLKELGEMCQQVDPSRAKQLINKVVLVEMGERLLPAFPTELSERVKKDLEDMGVEVCLGCKVEEINEKGAKVGDRFIKSRCIVWAAGVTVPEINKLLDVPKTKDGRIKVDQHLQVEGFDDVYCLGDQACFEDEEGRQLPGLASVAKQQGVFLGKKIAGKKTGVFKYKDFGQMAVVGTSKAVCDFRKFYITGRLGWYVWALIHILLLISFRNKVVVFFRWVWSYFTYQSGAKVVDEDFDLRTEIRKTMQLEPVEYNKATKP